jgi:hypothetical protein
MFVSFLKEWGRSTSGSCLWSFFWLRSACFWARRVEASGSGIGPQGRPCSGRRSLTSTPGGAGCSGRRGRLVGSGLFSIDGWSAAVLQRRFPAGGQARGGAVGHSFAAQGGMECCDRLRP